MRNMLETRCVDWIIVMLFVFAHPFLRERHIIILVYFFLLFFLKKRIVSFTREQHFTIMFLDDLRENLLCVELIYFCSIPGFWIIFLFDSQWRMSFFSFLEGLWVFTLFGWSFVRLFTTGSSFWLIILAQQAGSLLRLALLACSLLTWG